MPNTSHLFLAFITKTNAIQLRSIKVTGQLAVDNRGAIRDACIADFGIAINAAWRLVNSLEMAP
ncbi:MAG: hypothetical protein ACJAWS_003251 [Oleiphilaceae bacterium]|jgi:hypothetical protein